MRLKKALKIALPLAGLAAIAITIPVALTSCSSTGTEANQNYYSFSQADQISFIKAINNTKSTELFQTKDGKLTDTVNEN